MSGLRIDLTMIWKELQRCRDAIERMKSTDAKQTEALSNREEDLFKSLICV